MMTPGLSHHLTVTISAIPRDSCWVTLAHLQLCGIIVRWLLFNFEVSHLAVIGNCFCCLVIKLCLTLCDPVDFSTPGFPVLHYLPELLKLMSIESVMPSNPLILCHPPLLLPSIFPSIRVFSSESVLCIRWPKYWSFSFSISPSNEYSGLTSLRIDWFNLFAVQGSLKSLLQHQSSKPSILRHSAFFVVQLSHPYMPTGKTIALTAQTFVGKVISAF